MEMRFHQRLQVHCNGGLGNAVRNRRYAQHSLASVFLGYCYRSDRRREVRTRRHTIPNLVEIVLVEFVEFGNLDVALLFAQKSFVIDEALGRRGDCLLKSLTCFHSFLQLRVLDRFDQTENDPLVACAQYGQGFVVLFFGRRQQVVA